MRRAVQKKSSAENRGEDFKENFSLLARAARQVFPRYQLASQWLLERPVKRESSFQPPQAAGSWELDLSQE
jgi:hypothetical protein